MAKTYRELAGAAVKRGLARGGSAGAALAEKAVRLPANAARAAARIPGNMKTKAEVLSTIVEAKLLVHDRMRDDIDEAEFAYRMALDPNLRKTVSKLAEQVLQPTPVTADPEKKSNGFLNLSAGFSAYWTEMKAKLPVELETALGIESTVTNVTAGMDPDMDPDMRKTFLKEAGLSDSQIGTLVTVQDYVRHEAKARETLVDQVKADFGITGDREMTEEERLLVESVVEDRIMGSKQTDLADGHEPTYEETYGISAEDLYALFADDEPGFPVYPGDGDDVPVNNPKWEYLLAESGAMGNYEEALDASVEETMALFYEAEQEQIAGQGLTPDFQDDGFIPLTDEDVDILTSFYEEDEHDEDGFEPLTDAEMEDLSRLFDGNDMQQ